MVDQVKSPKEGEIEKPADTISAGSIKKGEQGRQPETSTPPVRISRRVIMALILLVALVIGSYLGWPKVRTLILDQLQTDSPQTNAAFEKLSHRVARLETANNKYERAIGSLKSIQGTISLRLDNLAKALPKSETLINLRRKLATMETTIANFDQKSGSSSFETLEQEVESLKTLYTELVSQPNQIKFNPTQSIPN